MSNKLLTFNAGLLLWKFLGFTIFESVKHTEARLKKIPEALCKTNASVIALQEVYAVRAKEYIINEVKDLYPHSAYHQKNGLLLLSKPKIINFNFIPYHTGTIEEKYTLLPGIMHVKINIRKKLINIFNVRITAGGAFRKHESPQTQKLQLGKIKQLLELVKKTKGPSILMGDFNAGPSVLKDTFNAVLKAGFKDVLASSKNYTWDPKNYLNQNGYHKDSPPQRIDHIFISPEFKFQKPSLTFTTPKVILDSGKKITLSDHYAVQATVQLR